MVTCMALTAPQEADMVDSLSKVTELGRFCTITCSEDHHHFFKGKVAKDITRSIKTGGAAALGGSFCWGVIVIEVRDGDGLCRIGAGPLGWRGPP